MKSNKKFTFLEILVITFLVMCVVPVCGLNDSSADISAYPSIVNPGDEIRVTFSGVPGFELDWIAMYKVGDPNEGEYEGAGFYLEGEKSGTLSFTAPDEPGDYDFRLFEDDGYTDIARSNIVTVQGGTLQTSEEATILFDENFDDGYAPGFGNEVGNWEVHLLYPYTGKYTATTDTYRFSMAGDTNWQDYVIEADFFNAQDGGLLVRAQDQDNCIALIVRPSYNDIYWYVRKGGMWADYKGQVTLGHEPGEELQVKVKVAGSEFKAYVNDVLKTTLENAEFPKGKIGLYLYYQPDQYWDNVVVYSSGATGPAPTPTTPTEGGLVGYWNFNEGSGNIAYDSSGSGNDGTIHGATFVSGISGHALSFDGKGNYVSVPVDINPTVMPQMTITAWVRADNDSGTIVSHDDGGFDRTIDIDTRGGGKGWSAFSGSGVVGYSPVTIGEWFFLAAVYDQSAETVKLYVNGALISEEKGKLGSGWDYINIGKNPSFGDYFSGTVDEVMIYNYDLTESEVKSIYVGGEAPEEEESGYGDIKVTYISWEEVQEKYTVSYDETFKYDDDGDGANEATLYYKGENNLVMSSDDTDKDGKVDLIFHYDDEGYLTRAIRDTDGDGEFDQILHFNRDEEIIKVEKIRSDDTRNSILFIILSSIIFFLVMCFWLYVTKKQSCNSKMNDLNYMGRINHQLGRRLILILISFLIIFALFVPPVSSLEDVIDDDCNIIQDVFDRDWKKYSNLENTPPYTFEEYPLTARSWETQQYYAAQSKIVDAEVQIFFLKRDMEIDRHIRLELKEYEEALKDGHRKNLLKSFARLSFLTVQTVYEAYGAGKSVGKSYVNLFTTPSSVSAAGSVLKITDTYNSMAPPDSSALAKNTQSITKSVDAVSKNVAHEALESLGDPTKVGTELVKQVIDAVPVPHKAKDWKLTDDDFNILREEHLEMKGIGKIIAKSYEVNLERKDKVRELEAQIKELEKELAEWETKEKNRVKALLVYRCKNEKKEKCDSEHLSLCDNENDCEDAGGYWYNNNCNDEPEEIKKGKIAITACTTSCIVLQTVKLTVMGIPDDQIRVCASPLSSHVKFQAGVDDTPYDVTDCIIDVIDEDGIRRYEVKFDDSGTFTIRVTVISGPRAYDSDSVEISVSRE
ncbi:glucanases superfamily protein [Methanophagales archaeon]|nr:glucanases superfamily protein [Methanophagales archaeon]